MALQEFDAEAGVLARRRALAQSLMSQPAPQGRMVGRVYVGANPLEQLAHGLRQVAGTKDLQAADSAEIQLQQRRQAQGAEDAKRFAEILRGKPSETIPNPVPNDDNGNVMPQAQTQAVPGDPVSAYSFALGSQSPMIRQMGAQGMVQLPQLEARKAERADEREFRAQQLQQQHAMRMEQMAAQNASRQEMMRAQQEFQRQMVELKQSMGGQGSQPYFQPVQTGQGVFSFNARTGKMEPVSVNGAPVVGAQADPALQGAIAGAKAGAQTEAKERTEARLEAPKVVAQGEETIKLVDDLLNAPGFKQAVGKSRVMQIQRIPGTDAKDFDIRLDQLKGKQFLQAFETLKGGGQITEMEGKKATDAIARMDAAGTEEEFVKAAREFQQVIRQGVERAKGKAQMPTNPSPAPAGAPRKVIRYDDKGNRIQ